MIEATLCFVLDDPEVLLIEKLRGLGDGLYNAPGGKLEPGESPAEAAIREVHEEVSLAVNSLEKAAELTFRHDDTPTLFVHVFRTTDYHGTPQPSPEADPEWFHQEQLPFHQMWDDDHLWVPPVLDGECLIGTFDFEGGEALDEANFVDYTIETVPSFATT